MTIDLMPWPDAVASARTNDVAHVLALSAIADALPSGAYIAGGALTRLFSRTSLGDIDVFCESEIAFEKTLKILRTSPPAGYWGGAVAEPPDSGDEEDNEPHSHGWTIGPAHPGLPPIQVVGGRHFSTPQAQIVRFDFTCCQMALTSRADGLQFGATSNAVRDARDRIIRIANTEEPERYGQRLAKYRRKGFRDARDVETRTNIDTLLRGLT